MRRILGSALAAGAVIVAFGWAATVFAQDKEAIIKDRQATMKAQGQALSGVKKWIDGAVDQAAATKSADDLVRISQSIPSKFENGKGTSTVDFPGKSGAKPVVWTEWDKFVAADKADVALAEKLSAAVKSGDKAAAGQQFAAIGKNGCGACHTTFREKRE